MKCRFCGAEFPSIQAVRGHLRSCKSRPTSVVTSVRISDEANWVRFKAFCKKHGLTTCHVINMVVTALPMVDQAGVHFEVKDGKINISGTQGTNPLVFNFDIHEYFGSRPRGHGKYDLAELAADPLTAVVQCSHLVHKDWVSGRLGWCSDVKRWVTPELCAGCVRK